MLLIVMIIKYKILQLQAKKSCIKGETGNELDEAKIISSVNPYI